MNQNQLLSVFTILCLLDTENKFKHHWKTVVGFSLSTAGRCCSVELHQAHNILYLDFHAEDGSIHFTIP